MSMASPHTATTRNTSPEITSAVMITDIDRIRNDSAHTHTLGPSTSASGHFKYASRNASRDSTTGISDSTTLTCVYGHDSFHKRLIQCFFSGARGVILPLGTGVIATSSPASSAVAIATEATAASPSSPISPCFRPDTSEDDEKRAGTPLDSSRGPLPGVPCEDPELRAILDASRQLGRIIDPDSKAEADRETEPEPGPKMIREPPELWRVCSRLSLAEEEDPETSSRREFPAIFSEALLVFSSNNGERHCRILKLLFRISIGQIIHLRSRENRCRGAKSGLLVVVRSQLHFTRPFSTSLGFTRLHLAPAYLVRADFPRLQ